MFEEKNHKFPIKIEKDKANVNELGFKDCCLNLISDVDYK
jgi:hypothetical protein